MWRNWQTRMVEGYVVAGYTHATQDTAEKLLYKARTANGQQQLSR